MPPTLTDQEVELLLRALCGISTRLDRVLREGAPMDPRMFMPRNAIRVDLPQDHRSNVAVVGFGTFSVTWDRVPQAARGVVAKIWTNTTDFDNTTWTARINGVPLNTFNGMMGAFGALGVPEEILPLDLNPGDVFSLVATNLGAAAITVGVRTIGWFWFPEEGA